MSANIHWKKRFYLLWSGQAVSLLTSAMVQYAILWHLTASTGSAAVLSLAAMMGFLPMALFSPFIGSLVDRFSRKRMMIFSDLGIALLAVLLAVLSLKGELPLGLVYGVLFLRSLGTAFHQPCLQAITPLIVPEDQLSRCAGMSQAFQSVSMILSPGLAAFAYGFMPLPLVIALDAVGAAVGILTVAFQSIPATPHDEIVEKQHVLKDALQGLKYLHKQKGLFALVMIASLFSLAYVPAASLYPLMVLGYFGGTTYHAGLVEMAFSAGMLAGGLLLGLWGGPKRRIHIMAASAAVIGACLSGMGLLPPDGILFFGLFTLLSGLAAPFFSALFMALIQEKIRPDYLGRVLGVSSSLMSLACPLGLILAGGAAERIGAGPWFLFSGILCVVCAALCMLFPSVRRVDEHIKA